MSIINGLASLIFNNPVLDLATLGSNQDVVLVDLVQLCRLVAQFEGLNDVLSSSLEVHDGDVHEGLSVVGEHQDSGRALDDSLAPLNLNHAVLVTGNSS